MAYKYNTPHDWLLTQAQTWNADQLFSALEALSGRLDADSLQDLFQEEMAANGYFEDTPAP